MRQIIIAIVLSAFLSIPSQAQPMERSVDIEKMTPGQPPSGFAFGRTGKGSDSRWLVVDDSTAQNGRAIAQVSQDTTDYRFPLAIYESFNAKDVEVTVRFKPVSGKVDQAGGIAVRLTGPDHYYVVRANALEDNVRFYRVVKGNREQIAGTDTKVAPNQWHTLGLKAVGSTFMISFDGKELYTAKDTTFAESGRIALWTKADSVTHFDRLTITEAH